MEGRKNERNESHLWRKGERTKPTKDKTMYGRLEWTEWHVREAKPIYVRMPEFRTLVDVDIQLLYLVYEAFPLRRVNRLIRR